MGKPYDYDGILYGLDTKYLTLGQPNTYELGCDLIKQML